MIKDVSRYVIELLFFVPAGLTEPDPVYLPNTERRITDPRVWRPLSCPMLDECPGGYLAEVAIMYKSWTRAEVEAEQKRLIDLAVNAGLILKEG